MNIDRHVNAHFDFFDHLVTGDGDSAATGARAWDMSAMVSSWASVGFQVMTRRAS